HPERVSARGDDRGAAALHRRGPRRPMKTVEITYRYQTGNVPERTRPDDADAARTRLDEGNRAFAALLDSLAVGRGTVRRVIDVDPRDFGAATSEGVAPPQQPYAAVLGCADARVPI